MFITVPTSYIQYRSSNGIADEYFRPDNSTTLHGRGTLVGYNTASQYVSTSANKRPTDNYFYVNEFTKFDENMDEQWVCGIMSPYIYPSIMVRSKFCPNEAYAIFTPDPTQWRSGEIVWTLAKAPSNEAIALAKAGALLNDSNWATKTPDKLVNDVHYGLFDSSYGIIRMTDVLTKDSGGARHLESTLAWVPNGEYDSMICDWQYPWDTAAFKANPYAASALSGMDSNTPMDTWVPPYEVWRCTEQCRSSFTFDHVPTFKLNQTRGHTDWADLVPHGFLKSVSAAFQFEACFFYPTMYKDYVGDGSFDVCLNNDIPDYRTLNPGQYYDTYMGGSAPSYMLDESVSGNGTRYFGTPVWQVDFNGFPEGVIPSATDVAASGFFNRSGTEPEECNWYCVFVKDVDQFRNVANNAALSDGTSNEFYNMAHRESFTTQRRGKDDSRNNCMILFAGSLTGKRHRPVFGYQRGTFCHASLDQVGTNSKWEYGRMRMSIDGMDEEFVSDVRPTRNQGCTLTPSNGEESVTLTYVGNSLFPVTTFPTDLEEMGKTTVLDGASMFIGAFEIGRYASPIQEVQQ